MWVAVSARKAGSFAPTLDQAFLVATAFLQDLLSSGFLNVIGGLCIPRGLDLKSSLACRTRLESKMCALKLH